MDISEHALFRYGQRVKNEVIINQQSYSALAKTEPNKVKIWKDEIIKLFEESIFLIQGIFDKDNKTSNFYVNVKEKIIFVVDSSKNIIVTLYKVDYGFGDKVNTITMNELLKEIEKFKKDKEKYQNKEGKHIGLKKMALVTLDEEIKMLNSKIKALDIQKAILETEMDLYKLTLDNYDKEIECKAHSIAHSIGYKRQEEFN